MAKWLDDGPDGSTSTRSRVDLAVSIDDKYHDIALPEADGVAITFKRDITIIDGTPVQSSIQDLNKLKVGDMAKMAKGGATPFGVTPGVTPGVTLIVLLSVCICAFAGPGWKAYDVVKVIKVQRERYVVRHPGRVASGGRFND